MAEDSNMPAYRFLYKKRRITGVASPEAINFAGDTREEPEVGWEIVPTYDATMPRRLSDDAGSIPCFEGSQITS